MDFSNFWWQAAAAAPPQPGGDPGDAIGQSLRFGAGKVLTGTGAALQNDWTASWWFKYAVEGAVSSERIMCGAGGSYFSIFELSNPSHQFFWSPTFPGAVFGPPIRDPSAWYHVVLQSTATKSTVWLNGEQIGTSGSAGSTNFFQTIGRNTNNTNFEGLMAGWHVIDGQALDPTTFGRFNANDVWVPVDPKKDGDTIWYGTNGFHLTFADPGDLGKDYSGNGNDFTATGFDLQPYVNWISGLTTDDPGGFSASYPAKNAFDGNTATYAATTTNGNNTLFTPPTPISYTTSLKVFCCVYPGQEFKINGVAVTPTSTGCGWFIDESGPGTLTTFEIGPVASPAGQGAFLYAIEVDGVILVDSPNYFGYDLVQDSPTNNFATLNPILSPNNQTLTNANLAGSGAASDTSLATQVPTHKYYWEGYGSNYYHGLTAWDSVRTSYLGATVDQVGLFNDGSIYVSGGVQAYGPWFGATNIVMQAYDPSTGEYWAGRDGVWHNGSDPAAGTGALYTVDAKYREKMAPANNVAGSGFICPHNYGQQPFKYTPPAGFKPLSTANMPAAPIARGKDHFQAITGPGAGGFKMYPEGTASTPGTGKTTEPLDTGGVYTYTPTTFGYVTPSYVLDAFLEQSSITFINNPGWYANGPIRLYTSADGINWTREADIPNLPETSLTFTATSPARYWRFNWDDDPNGYKNFGNITSTNAPILELAQTAFPSGLWWIKDRANANEHQLVDSVRGGNLALTCPTNNASQAYVAPTGESVAWCWNYNSADPSQNGFDVVGPITGTIAQRTIPHNLGAPPKFIIARGLASGQPPCTYHSEVGAGGMMYLNSSNGVDSRDVFWGGVEPTSTEFTVGNSTHTNPTSEIIYYLWSEIPGYSAFGSYTGNSNADGPFVYLGFRPAFVMFKTITATNWSIQDSTRAPYNPCVDDLVPNSTSGESGAAMNVDFLSNGFKVRIGNANINSSTVLYCAFAENPIQSPVTAR